MAITINYKGTSCRGTDFLYICPSCEWEQKETHPAAEEPKIQCPSCNRCDLHKKPTALNLDADQHQDSMSWNRGWDYDESKE